MEKGDKSTELWRGVDYKRYMIRRAVWQVVRMEVKHKWDMVFGLVFLVGGLLAIYMGTEELFLQDYQHEPVVWTVLKLLFFMLGCGFGLGMLSGLLIGGVYGDYSPKAPIFACAVMLFVHSIVFAVFVADCEHVALGICYGIIYTAWTIVCIIIIAEAWTRNAIEEWENYKKDVPFTEDELFEHLLKLIR